MSLFDEMELYRPALVLDRVLARKKRTRFVRGVGAVLFIFFLCAILIFVYCSVKEGTFLFSSFLTYGRIPVALFFILLGPALLLFALSIFYNARYFRGVRGIQYEHFKDSGGITLELAAILEHDTDDLARAFVRSPFGKEVLYRAGVPHADIDTFVSSHRARIPQESFIIDPHSFSTPHELGVFLITTDPTFQSFLLTHGVTEVLFRGTLSWINERYEMQKYRERWWGRDHLGKLQGIGREFSYGVAHRLRRYMRDIRTTAVLSLLHERSDYAKEVIDAIEGILARERDANVVLVAEPGTGEMDILMELGTRMREGRSVASITGKRLVVFDTQLFLTTHQSREAFETNIVSLFAEAEAAGNIIIVIENFPHMLRAAKERGSDLVELLKQFMNSEQVQIVGTADPRSYHESFEQTPALMEHFQAILIEHPDLGSTIRVLEDALVPYEMHHTIFFTYPGLVRIAENADRYIVEGVMPDKALDLMADTVEHALKHNRVVITPELVDLVSHERTGVPAGRVDERERELLLHLEERLHERVVGQHEAIKSIAGTMRRLRAGIQSTNRPIGSLLFLGSTGVGKTETAKALAQVFFGNESKLIRFDMSEYSDATSLGRLIGQGGTQGTLVKALKEHPYGVFLLDELEKAHEEVHDLLLQILDEGMFTDAYGVRVNARNTILIATSNAGSDRIWKLVRLGRKPSDAKDQIIDEIIEKKILKPELINRFDSVVVFEVLGQEAQKRIAELMLRELAARLKERGYILAIDEVLIESLLRTGFDPQFGARPLRRALQDGIEERIATRIIASGLRPGDTIRLTPEDLSIDT